MVNFKKGDEVFVFFYEPKKRFYILPSKIIEIEDDFFKVITTGRTVVTPATRKVYNKGDRLRWESKFLKSKTYVRNVLEKYSKEIIKDILSGSMS